VPHLNPNDYKIELNIGIKESILEYFSHARTALVSFGKYTKRHRELDFLKMRRFMHTTYKTLNEVDPEFKAEQLTKLYHNVEMMAKVYDDFATKSRFGMHSYEVIFLQKQEDFARYESMMEHNADEITLLRAETERYKESVALEKSKLKKTPKFLRDNEKEEALKRMKRRENSAIVRLGHIIEENIILSEVLKNFRAAYEEQFMLLFNQYTQNLKPSLLSILNAMAFEFDIEMWLKASESTVIRNFFKNAYAGDVISSKTYLTYYLKSLDPNKLNDEHKQLQELLEYLNCNSPLYCVIYMASQEDLEHFKTSLKADNNGIVMHGYVDAKVALSQAFKTRIDILVLDLDAQYNILESFISLYKKNSQHMKKKAKIMLVCSEINDTSIAHAERLGADSLMEKDVDAFEIIDTVYDLLKVENSDLLNL
jgi:hypothetical protein